MNVKHEVLHCATLSLQHYFVGQRYHITMSLQSQYVIGLSRCKSNKKPMSPEHRVPTELFFPQVIVLVYFLKWYHLQQS